MSYKIVMDSCCELPTNLWGDSRFEFVPLALEVGDYHIMDDENFDQQDFIKRMAESETCAKTACPSPDRYKQAFDTDADHVFCVTLSSKLSGSYNSALIGKEIYEEEGGDKKVYIVDSLSASSGETQIVFKLMELEEEGLEFEEIVEKINEFRDNMFTYFVLDSLENLRKNGRLTGMKALVATTLNIKPVCAGEKGSIVQKGQGVGMRKALMKMTDILVKECQNPEDRRLIISHCNCYERAMLVKDLIMAKAPFKEAIVIDTRGVSTIYASDGGIVVTC